MSTIITQDELMLLRTWTSEDADTLFRLNSNPNVIRFTGDSAFKDIDEARAFIANYDSFERYGCGRWMVEIKATKKSIGWCGVKYHVEENYFDLGFRLMEDSWGYGYATRASLLAMAYSKKVLNIQILKARAMIENTASIRVLKKIGFETCEVLEESGDLWQWFDKQL